VSVPDPNRRICRASVAIVVVLVVLVVLEVRDVVLGGGIGGGAQVLELALTLLLVALTAHTVALGVRSSRERLAAAGAREARLQALQDGHPDALLGLVDGRIAFANRRAQDLLERSSGSLVGVALDAVVAQDDVEATREALAGRTPVALDRLGLVSRSGELVNVRATITAVDTGSGIEQVLVARDLRALDAVSAQLEVAQRLEPVGQLVGGVAHDFRNFLTGVIASSWLLVDKLEGEDRELLEAVVASAHDAKTVVSQLLAFSRQGPVETTVLDLGQHIARQEPMLRRLLTARVELVLDVPGEPLTVLLDPGQVQQILLNLVGNARDALPDGGRLTIRLVRDAEHALVTVEDDGEGMPPAIVPQIFDPFFTTKIRGRGTGLGLATVHGIVTDAGGSIDVDSTLGVGTSFGVRLPLTAARPADRDPDVSNSPRSLGGECVLVVDDDPLVRATVVQILDVLGYEVLEAGDGDSALEQLARHRGRLHAVLTDVVMPGTGGLELALRIKATQPEVPVILMTGYSSSGPGARWEVLELLRPLQKPFSVPQLARAVREAVDGARAGRGRGGGGRQSA